MKAIEFTVPVYGEDLFALLEERTPNFYPYYHRHKELQVTYILKGKGTVMIGNVLQSFNQDDVFVIKPNEPHLFDKYGPSHVADEDPIHTIHLFINLEKMEKFFGLAEFEELGRYLKHIQVSKKLDSEVALSLRKNFLNLLQKTAIPKFTEYLMLLHSIALRGSESMSLYSGIRNITYSDKEGARISTVFKYTFDHFTEEISLAEIASVIHMTPTAFCKFFKKHTMKTYVGFLNEVRIERACQLLINKKVERISETAFKVGFNNVIHFNRVFKQITTLSPTRYLEAHATSAS